MYNPKFDYQPIPRVTVDGKRFYATPDGKNLPSVTTILDRTKSEESKAALHNWRRAVGAERAQAITTEAANRGTRMPYLPVGQIHSHGPAMSWQKK